MGKKDSQLLQLFEELQRIPSASADPAGELTHFPGFSNLNTLTRRLLDSISASLRAKHAEKTAESRLHHALETIAILYEKKLWDLAKWNLEKEKRIALRLSRLPQFLSLLEWERKLLLAQLPKNTLEQLESIRQSEEAAMQLFATQSQLSHLNLMTRSLIRQRLHASANSERQTLEEISALPLVEASLHAGDFLSRSYAHNIRGNWLNATGDYKSAIPIYTNIFFEWREKLAWIRERPVFFLSLFSNLQLALLRGQFDTKILEDCLLFIRNIRLPDPNTQLQFQNMSFQSGILVFMNRAKFDAAGELLAEIEEWRIKNRTSLTSNVHLTFLYNAVTVHFMVEDFAAARKTINQILDFPDRTVRKDIREFVRILEVVVGYEMGEWEQAEYTLRNVYQYFLRTEYPPHYRAAIEHLRHLLRLPIDHPPADSFLHFLRGLDRLDQTPSVKAPFGTMELRIWAMARQQKTSLRQVFEGIIASNRPDE